MDRKIEGPFKLFTYKLTCTVLVVGVLFGCSGNDSTDRSSAPSGSDLDGAPANGPFDVEPTSGAGGSIEPSAIQRIEKNEKTSFTVMPDIGYKVDSISGCGGSFSNNIYTTSPILAACTVSVTFSLNNYSVTTSADPNGTINPEVAVVAHGSSANFTVTPNDGYRIDSVNGCGGLLSNNIYTTGPILAACTVGATFSLDNYSVTASADSNGTISPEVTIVAHGSSTNFTVTPDIGYRIGSISGCGGTLLGNIYTTGAIFAPCTVSVNFTANDTSQLPFNGDEWFVKDGMTGSGSEADPFGTIQEAIDIAREGDGITIFPGTYNESLSTKSNATAQNPIVIQAKEGRGTVTITSNGRVLTVGHAYNQFSQLVFAGQYGDSDLIKVRTSADGWVLHNSEVKESSRDCIDMASPSDVVIIDSTIHHCLNAQGGRKDAHGIVGASVRNLLIKNTQVHSFSGDAFQVDPGRTSPGWDGVVIDGCQFWLEPLPDAVNGFAAGVVPGENAVDTKVTNNTRPKLKIVNSSFWGYRNGLITNMAALNLKESVDVVVDGVTIFDSDIAFRLRHPAQVDITNAIIHSVTRAVRYEDDIAEVLIWNSTFGRDIDTLFQKASSSATTFDIQNSLILSNGFPQEVSSDQNLIVGISDFRNANAHDYTLDENSYAVDRGVDLNIPIDRFGTNRPLGQGVDMGAVESY